MDGENERYHGYETDSEDTTAFFNIRCPKCGRWTKAPDSAHLPTEWSPAKCIAICAKCGEVELEYEGEFSKDECY